MLTQAHVVADGSTPHRAGALVSNNLRHQLHQLLKWTLIEEALVKLTIGGFFTLNPRVDDIPERFSVVHKGVRLLEMGSVDTGGSGCICPEAAMLKTLFTHLLFRKDDVLILDMYAGVEHLGRATVDFVDAMLIVVEPTRRSLGTASQIKQLANDIGLSRCWLVGNKVRNEDEKLFRDRNPRSLYPRDHAADLVCDRPAGYSVYEHASSILLAAKL
jgi:CO dehydrogenase nickel-insertion accessory protein CooC1